MRRVNLLAANLLDDVSGLHAGLFSGGVRQGFADDYAVIDVKLLSQFIGHFLHGNAEEGAVHFAVLDQIVDNLLDKIAGDGDAKADVATGHAARHDKLIDTNDFAFDVQQRAAAVAGVDGGVRLDVVVKRGHMHVLAFLLADVADGHGVLQIERRADGDGPLANAQLAGIRERQRMEFLLAVANLKDGEIGLFIDADDGDGVFVLLRVIDGTVRQFHFEEIVVLDDVVVCDDVAFFVNDDA